MTVKFYKLDEMNHYFINYKNWLKRGKNHNNCRLDEKVKSLPMKVHKARFM